jgi:hypothetical protein
LKTPRSLSISFVFSFVLCSECVYVCTLTDAESQL